MVQGPVTPPDYAPIRQVVRPDIGGASKARIKSAASTNATLVKGSPGVLYGVHVSTHTAGNKFLKLYDKATAPVVGTDIPAFTVQLPASSFRDYAFNAGLQFTNGIAYAITAGVADTDAVAVALDDVHGVLEFK